MQGSRFCPLSFHLPQWLRICFMDVAWVLLLTYILGLDSDSSSFEGAYFRRYFPIFMKARIPVKLGFLALVSYPLSVLVTLP